MADNLRFILTNLHDRAYVTATSEALPVAYTQRSERVRTWRSTDTTAQVITAGLPSVEFISAVVLYRHNLSGVATARLELLSGGDVVYDTGQRAVTDTLPLGKFRFGVDAWGGSTDDAIPIKHFSFWAPTTAADGYRVTLIDPGNTDGHLEVGRIIAGQTFSPRYNAAYGLQLEYQDFAEHRRTEGNSLRTVGEGLARRMTLDLNFLDGYDRRRLTSGLLKAGKRGDVYISVMPEKGGLDEAEYAFLARRESNHTHTHDFYQNWQSQIALVEV